MRFSRSVSAVGFFAALASAAVILQARDSSDVTLPIEETVLTDLDVADYIDLMGFGDDLGEDAIDKRASTSCKHIPGDSGWPSDLDWAILDLFVGDSLVKPDPIGKVCYPGSAYDAAKCANVIAEFSNSDLQWVHPPTGFAWQRADMSSAASTIPPRSWRPCTRD